MGKIKTNTIRAWHKTREYLASAIIVPILFIVAGLLIRILIAGGTIAMSEFMSWIEWILIPALLGLLAVFAWHFFNVGLLLKAISKIIRVSWKGITHLKKSGELLTLIDRQQKNRAEWLYPVVEMIDLNRQGSAHDDNDVYVTFQIDSHLLFEVKEFYVFATLCLKPDAIHENQSKWYEIKKPANYAPIGQLARYGFSDAIHLTGESDQEKCLLKWMEEFRVGKPLLSMLKIGVNFRMKENTSNPDFVLEGSRWIAPVNNYRGA